MAPDGLDILADTVTKRYPVDDQALHTELQQNGMLPTVTVQLADLIQVIVVNTSSMLVLQSHRQEIMQAHASGIVFREWNAGPKLDQRMRDNGWTRKLIEFISLTFDVIGFNVNVRLDSETGFLFGGTFLSVATACMSLI